MTLRVDDSHFAYLKLQRGRIASLADDRAAWQAAYDNSLDDDLAGMAPYLPEHCRALLDIGSGLGGIDAMLNRRYGGAVHVRLLDGTDDAPIVSLHDTTYNSMAVAADFLSKNGVRYLTCYSAHNASAARPDGTTYDLIVSLQSWCFHYAPDLYLPFVKPRCHAGTVLIVDVRSGKPLWRETMRAAFKEVACVSTRRKFNRLVFHV